MHRAFRNTIYSILVTVLLHACASSAPTQHLPEITFSHLQVFKFDVAKVEIENRYTSPLKAPHIEHLMPTAPDKALEQWLRDRFQAVGQIGSLRLIIEDARAIKTSLPLNKTLKGRLTKQQSQRYDMAVRATLHMFDEKGRTISTASARAERSITAREDISLNEREKLWFDTVNLLMTDFNNSMEVNIQSYLYRWLLQPGRSRKPK